ncbi:MAG: hypothetical protein IPM16_16260 [Chloroflexi bacterium]|nr:hypothetical protein [Chloroflexota bacterium]
MNDTNPKSSAHALEKQLKQLTPVLAEALAAVSADEDDVVSLPDRKTRRELIAAWIGSIESDARDASTSIDETLKQAYGDAKQPAD